MKRFFEVVRVLDSKGNFSLTNASVYAIMTRLLTANSITLVDGIAALIIFVGYGWKRWINFQEDKAPKATKTVMELTETLEFVKTQIETQKNLITSLSTKAGIMRPVSEFVTRNIRKF